MFVRVDLHKNNYVTMLTNCFGDKIKAFNLRNALAVFPAFVEQVKKKADGKEIIFGSEDVNFYGRSLAKYLLDAGYIVKEVNASYTKKQRTIGTNHNKSDELDALVFAKILIFEYRNLPSANLQDVYPAIKQTLNTRNNHVQMAANIKISLQNILVHHYPMHKEFIKDLESKTAKGFFMTYPSPNLLEGVAEGELINILKKFNKSIPKKKAQEILSAIKYNGCNKTDYQEEQNESVISFLASLEHLESQDIGLDQVLEHLIEVTEYPLKTMNCIHTVLAATFIANIGDISRFSISDKLAKLAGIVPLEHSSGESQSNYSTMLGNRDLNKAFYPLALT